MQTIIHFVVVLAMSFAADVSVYDAYDYFSRELDPSLLDRSPSPWKFTYHTEGLIVFNILIDNKPPGVTVVNVTYYTDLGTFEAEKYTTVYGVEYYSVYGFSSLATLKIKLNLRTSRMLCSSILLAEGWRRSEITTNTAGYKSEYYDIGSRHTYVLVVDLKNKCEDPPFVTNTKANTTTVKPATDVENIKNNTANCEPACKNSGICIATNTCECSANFHGKYCELDKRPCLSYPPLPMNSARKCSPETCTITCMEGHKFIDGSNVAHVRCTDGQWQPTRNDFSSIPDCMPECSPPCTNGGVCVTVNTCECPAEFQGSQCQYSNCEPACKNSGICIATNTCECSANFHGKYCELDKRPCLSYPPLPMNSARKCSPETCTITCMEGHKFIDGSNVAHVRCTDGQWQPTRNDFSSIPDCMPECSPPCTNGGVCVTVNTCECPAEFQGSQCQYSNCEPACKNSGICIATNTCECSANFHGKYCELDKRPCLSYPPLPMNSARKCSPETCTITCMEGHKFIDGSNVAHVRCTDGQWQPTRTDFSSIPDCMPDCSPPCTNGGVCVTVNTCECPAEFQGSQCQYYPPFVTNTTTVKPATDVENIKNNTDAQTTDNTTVVIVSSTFGVVLVLLVIIAVWKRCWIKRNSSGTPGLPAIPATEPFYPNMLFRRECDEEIAEIEQHQYEEIDPQYPSDIIELPTIPPTELFYQNTQERVHTLSAEDRRECVQETAEIDQNHYEEVNPQ